MTQVSLEKIEDVALGIRTFWFRPNAPIRYVAGQFIELYVPHANPDLRGERRWFTLSSSPTESLVSITTKFTALGGSTFKSALNDLQLGKQLLISEPMGDFVLPMDKHIPLLFVAGGIGITPVRSIAQWMLDTGDFRKARLLYAAGSPTEYAFQEIFERAKFDTEYTVRTPSAAWSGMVGPIHNGHILERLATMPGSLVYISGPEPMVESLVHDLEHAGIPNSHLVTDYYPGYEPI